MIYVVRHGHTDWNINNKLQGRTDIPLNEKGIKTAEEAKEQLKDIKFDYIFSSPLLRAKETCEIIAGEDKAKIKLEDRLLERNHGELEGKFKNEYDKNNLWSLVEPLKYPSVETIEALRKRIYNFLDSIKELEKNNKNILLVSHVGAIRLITEYFNGKPASNSLLEYSVDNSAILKFTFKK